MRKIQFRGKRTDNGEWVYGVPVIGITSGVFMVWIESEAKRGRGELSLKDVVRQAEVIPETVGQYTGLKDYNYSAFIDTTADIRDLTGCHIVHTACMPRGLRWQDYIDFSLQLIRFCQAIAVLPNSEDSFGVKHELDFARERELPIFYLDEGYDALVDWAQKRNK